MLRGLRAVHMHANLSCYDCQCSPALVLRLILGLHAANHRNGRHHTVYFILADPSINSRHSLYIGARRYGKPQTATAICIALSSSSTVTLNLSPFRYPLQSPFSFNNFQQTHSFTLPSQTTRRGPLKRHTESHGIPFQSPVFPQADFQRV